MARPTRETRPRVGVSITVPDSWYEFDIDPATRDATIRDLVGTRLKDTPGLRPYRSDIERELRKLARRAWDSGALYCGAMAEGFEGVPLTASVTIAIVRATSTEGAALSTAPEAIAATLRTKEARSLHDTWRRATLVEIPQVGAATRAYGVDDVELPDDPRVIRTVQTETFVPIPGTDHVALIACASPVVDLAAGFHDLFDAITSTFRFVELPPDGT